MSKIARQELTGNSSKESIRPAVRIGAIAPPFAYRRFFRWLDQRPSSFMYSFLFSHIRVADELRPAALAERKAADESKKANDVRGAASAQLLAKYTDLFLAAEKNTKKKKKFRIWILRPWPIIASRKNAINKKRSMVLR